MLKKTILFLLIIFAIGILASPILVHQAEKKYNITLNKPPYNVSNKVLQLHNNMLTADLHADPLLWGRDLNQESDYGHVDFPRMEKANLGLQVFGLVTKSPKGQNFSKNAADTDRLTPLVIAQHWPKKTWSSLLQRALYQSKRLHDFAQQSKGKFKVITSKSSLNWWLKQRKQKPSILAGLLGLEGAHALESDISNLDQLHSAGVRMIGLAHFFDNHFAGSAHGIEQGGLSSDGKKLVIRAQKMGMLIDLAHSSPRTIDEVLAITKKPLVVSHTGVKATCNSPRNLSDKQIQAIAESGGVIGIAIFKGATCGSTIDSMLDAVDYVAKLVGVDYIGLGMDMDGAVTSPIDIQGLPLITEGLINRGYVINDIKKIMGENVIRLLQETLMD